MEGAPAHLSVHMSGRGCEHSIVSRVYGTQQLISKALVLRQLQHYLMCAYSFDDHRVDVMF